MSYDIRKWTANEAKRRPRRRFTGWAILLAIALSLGLAFIATFFHNPFGPRWPDLATIWLPMLPTMTSPFARETWFTDRGVATFDEFERAALFRATTRAYLIYIFGVAAFLGWLWLGTQQGWSVPDTPHASGTWCLAALGIAVSLPVAVAELTVPFPPTSEEEEGEL